jgi:hypothetical protein
MKNFSKVAFASKWFFSLSLFFLLGLVTAGVVYACHFTSHDIDGCSSNPCDFSPGPTSHTLTVSGVIDDAFCNTCTGSPENEGSIAIFVSGSAITGGTYSFSTSTSELSEGPFTRSFNIPFTGAGGTYSGSIILRAHGTPPIPQASFGISGSVLAANQNPAFTGVFDATGNHPNTGDGSLVLQTTVTATDPDGNTLSAVQLICESEPTGGVELEADTNGSASTADHIVKATFDENEENDGAAHQCNLNVNDGVGGVANQVVTFESKDPAPTAAPNPSLLPKAGGGLDLEISDIGDEGEAGTISVSASSGISGVSGGGFVLDGSGSFTQNWVVTTDPEFVSGSISGTVTVGGKSTPFSVQVGDGGGRRRHPDRIDIVEDDDPRDIPVDEDDPRDLPEDVDDPRDEGESFTCEEICEGYLKAARIAVTVIQSVIPMNIDIYPLNGAGAVFGPVFGGANTYTMRSIERRQQAADEYFTKQMAQYQIILSDQECYHRLECFKTPCLPCEIDTSVLVALRARMATLAGQLSYLEAVKNEIPELREKEWNDATLDKAIKDKEAEIASWVPIVERENAFVLHLMINCENMAKSVDAKVCDRENVEEEDDPRDVTPPPDVFSCRECGYFYTAATIVHQQIYRPHIEYMIEKYKADPSRMYEFNRDGSIKTKRNPIPGSDTRVKVESREFVKDREKEARIRAFMNQLVQRYIDCRSGFPENDPECPVVKLFEQRPDKCQEICKETESGFNKWAQDVCQDISDEDTRKEQRDIERQIREKMSQLNRNASRSAQLGAALGQARAQLGSMIAQGQDTQRAEASIDKGQQMADQLEAEAEQLSSEMAALQRSLEALKSKKPRDDMEDEFNERRKDWEACIECINSPPPSSLDDLCPKGEEGDEGEGGQEGGDGDADSGDGQEGEDALPDDPDGDADSDSDDADDDSTRAGGGGSGPDPVPVDPPPAPIPPPPPTDAEFLAAEKLKNQTTAGTPVPGTSPETDGPTPPADQPEEGDGTGGTGTATGSGSQTTFGGPGSQPRSVSSVELLAGQLCKSSLEAQKNSLQQHRESQIRQGVSTEQVDGQIASVNQRLEGRGDDPVICQVPGLSCRAGTFARLENIRDALAIPGISAAEKSQLEQARDQLNAHIRENCPAGSLSCSNLQDYRDHLSSQKSAEGIDQTMLQQEIDGLDRELETQHCAQRTIRSDGAIVHTYSDGRVRIEEVGPPRTVKVGTYNEEGEFVPSSTATFHSNGNESWTIKNPDGSTTDREVTKNPDGSTETVEVNYNANGNLTGTRVITEEPEEDGKVKKTTVIRDENGDVVTTSTTTTDPTDHSQVRVDVVKDPEVSGQTLHTTTRTNADGSTETRTTIVRPNGSEVVLDPVYTAAECTEDKERIYDEYLSRSANLFSMASRVQFAEFMKENADALERLQTFKTCGELPSVNVPCPGNCAENSPVIQELKSMLDTYNNSSDSRFRTTMQSSIGEFLNRNSNQSDLSKYFACSQGMQSIAEMSSAGFNDPLISQCSDITIPQLPQGMSFVPQSSTRTEITDKGTVTVVTDADGNETVFRRGDANKIEFSGSDGSGGEITRNTSDNSVTTKTQSADGTYVEEVVTYPPGTPIPEVEAGDTDISPEEGAAALTTKTTTIRPNGTIEIRETDPTGQTTVHSGTWTEGTEEGKISVDITQSQVSGSGPCDACRSLNMDLVNGYHRWQEMFRMLNNGTIGLSDGSKAIPAHDYTSPNSPNQTLPGLNSQIRNAEFELSAANSSLSNAQTGAAKSQASQRVRDAARKMNDLQTAANSSYQVARQIHQEYDQWQKNLDTLSGGREDFENLRGCHDLVKDGTCKSPVQCDGNPKCVFGDDRPLENLNLEEYLNSFGGSSGGPGGHYSNGHPRKWIEDPQDREQRLASEQGERPENVEVTSGENGTSTIRVINGNTVTTTVEHPDGTLTIDTEIKNENGELVSREIRYPNGNRETTTVTSSNGVKKSETILVPPGQVAPVVIYQREDYTSPSSHGGLAFREQSRDPVTGTTRIVEGKPETYKDGITVLPDGGMQVTVKDENGTVLETYVAIAMADQELQVRITSIVNADDPCSVVPEVSLYTPSLSKVLESRGLEARQRLRQTNEQRARNGQAGYGPEDYIKDGNIVPAGTPGASPVDEEYRAVYEEGQELSQALQRYHDLMTELQGPLQTSTRTPAQIVRDIENLFDLHGQQDYFPSLRQIINEGNTLFRGNCPDTRYASSVGSIDVTRGITSKIGTKTTFVPVDSSGRATGSFVGTPSTRTVRMAVPHPEIANPCVYPGENQVNAKREEILTALLATGIIRENAVSQIDTIYSYWKDISESSEINDDLTATLETFQDVVQGDLANVWQLVKQAHNITCEGNVFTTRAGNLRVDDVPAPSTTVPVPGGPTSSIGRVVVQDLKTNVSLEPCSFGDALRRLTGLLNTPGVDEKLKNSIRQALPGFREAMALQQGIAHEENPSALRARVQQYYEYLLSYPDVLSLVSGLYKDEIEAKTCSLYALSNHRFGTQETTVGLIAPPKEGETRTVENLNLEGTDPCLRSIPSSKYSGFLKADFDRRVEELRERTAGTNTETLNAINEQRWGDIRDPQWQAYHQEYQQMSGALQQYSQLKTELGRASSEVNSAVFNDLIRRMEDLMRNNRQTDHFPPLLEVVQTGERAELGVECVTTGESLLMTESGPIRIKWPTQLSDPTRACLELETGKLPPLLDHLGRRKEQLMREGGEQLVQEVFQRVFAEMVESGQISTEKASELRQQLGIRESVSL